MGVWRKLFNLPNAALWLRLGIRRILESAGSAITSCYVADWSCQSRAAGGITRAMTLGLLPGSGTLGYHNHEQNYSSVTSQRFAMRKIFTFLFLAACFAANAGAQSGRRGITPPPLPPTPTLAEPAIQPSMGSRESARPAPAELRAVPETLLNRQFKSLDKGSFSFSDFGGKVLVVNIWASWCGPCRQEVPEYEKVRKAYVGRAVEFIGLTGEDPMTSANRVKQFVRDVNFGFRLGWADRETVSTLMNGRNAIPQTLIIAPDGRILSHWRGYSRGQGGDRLREAIESALSETSSATPTSR